MPHYVLRLGSGRTARAECGHCDEYCQPVVSAAGAFAVHSTDYPSDREERATRLGFIVIRPEVPPFLCPIADDLRVGAASEFAEGDRHHAAGWRMDGFQPTTRLIESPIRPTDIGVVVVAHRIRGRPIDNPDMRFVTDTVGVETVDDRIATERRRYRRIDFFRLSRPSLDCWRNCCKR